jgi:hypothetical protein
MSKNGCVRGHDYLHFEKLRKQALAVILKNHAFYCPLGELRGLEVSLDEFENNMISQYELRDRWKSHVHQVQSTLILLAFTKGAIVWRYGTLNVREEFAKERHHWFAYLRKCAASGHRLISIIMQHAIVRSEVTLLPTIR